MSDPRPYRPARAPARLADQEKLLAEREQKLLEREEAVLRRERAYSGRHLALAEREASLRIREEALHRRATKIGPPGEVMARLTSPEKSPRVFDPRQQSYEALEVARDARLEAVARREETLIGRLDAVTSRFRSLEQQEGMLVYHEELLRLRDEEVSRMSQRLDELEQASLAAALPPAPRTPRPASALETPGDRRVDQLLASKAPVEQSVPPAPRREPSVEAPAKARPPRIGLKVFIGMESEHNFYTGFTQNISSGGLFIATHNTLDVGRQVELLFHLPGGQAISTQGEVAWIRDYNEQNLESAPGMGIRFLDLTPKDSALIREFIAAREPIFFDED